MKNYLVIGARWSLRSTKSVANALPFNDAIRLAGGNTGNLVIGEAVHRQLMGVDGGASAVFNRLPVLLQMPPKQLEAVYDAVVIAASNFIGPKTDLTPFSDLIESLNIPVIVLGLGAELDDDGEMAELPVGSERFLSLIKERCELIGLRGEATADYFLSRGINNVQVIGCPSYYWHGLQGPPVPSELVQGRRKKGLFSITRDRNNYDSHKQLKSFQKELIHYALANPECGYVIQSNFAEAWMAYHATEDAQHLENMMNYFEISQKDVSQLLSQSRIFFNITDWKQYVSGFDYALGSRFHGNMIALQSGVPALWITHDYRTREMCEFLGLPQVHISELKQKELCIDTLLDSMDYGSFRGIYQKRYVEFSSFMQKNGLRLSNRSN